MTTPPSSGPEPASILAVALEAAAEAREVHLSHLGRVRPEHIAEKGASDFVSHVDHEAEARIVARIRAAFPGHRILAEEGAGHDEGGRATSHESGWLWVIDPLDGTTNYLHGYPAFSLSIALLREGVPEVGVVLAPATGETWTAVRGQGAFRNGVPVHVSGVDRLRLALIGTGFPFKALHRLPAYLRQFDRVLRSTAGIRRAGSAALDLCHVATGYFDGFWELVLAPWDVSAGILMIREAGGIVTRMDGGDVGLESGSLLAGNPAVHAALGAILNQENEL
jgi:myo-inositol-1(or 4)-monophosphatase